MKAGYDRCLSCDREFPAAVAARLCPACRAHEDRVYANGPMADLLRWKYSRSAMQERLSVSGKVDE